MATKTDSPDWEHNPRNLAWGLNLDEPEITTQAEIDEFRRVSAAQLGVQQDGWEFLLDEAPEVLKRYRIWAALLRVREADEAPNKWNALMIPIQYVFAMVGFVEGVLYQLHDMNQKLTKAQIVEQMALVFRYSGPLGIATLAKAARQHSFHEPTNPVKWPSGWAPDPDAFKSGANFKSREASKEDVRKILDWYERLLGEVPRHVSFLARHRPELLKAYRGRYENTLRELPKQTEPFVLVQISILRGFGGGIREGMLLGRAFGITKPQILEAISWGTFFGGHESLNLVDEVAGDIMDTWPE